MGRLPVEGDVIEGVVLSHKVHERFDGRTIGINEGNVHGFI